MFSKTVSFGITDIRTVEVTCAKCGATLAISLRTESSRDVKLHESSLMCACGEPLWMLGQGFEAPVPQFIGALVLAYAEFAKSRPLGPPRVAMSSLRLAIDQK